MDLASLVRVRPGRALVVLVLALTAGCGERGPATRASRGGPASDSAGYGGTAVIGYLAEANSMNSLVSTTINSAALQNYVLFTPLIRYDASLQPQPCLAERWDTAHAGDELALTFHLRHDVRWHDGAPTTARDVAFTFKRIKDPATAYPNASAFSDYDSVVVQDSFTVTFYLKPHPGYLDPWRFVSPMPEHILGDVQPQDLGRHPFGTVHPVGNGPFRFVEHRPGDRWIFEANPDYPKGLGGRPHLDRLIYRVIPEPTTLLSEFLAGNVDVYISVVPSQVATLAPRPDVRMITYPSRNYVALVWNERRPLFADRRVRRALTLGLDRAAIVEATRSGLGQVATGPVPPWHWAYDADIAPLPYDPERARQLLTQAGWVDRDGDGVRERGNVRASFELKMNPNRVRQDIAAIVQADLARIGVEVHLRVQDAQSLLADMTGAQRHYDAIILGWGTEFRLDDRDLFSCSARDRPFQFAQYCNPRVDELLDAVTTLEDRDRTLPMWREYEHIIQEDQPFTFIYYETQANAVRSRLHDVRMDIRSTLLSVADWWIAPGDRRAP